MGFFAVLRAPQLRLAVALVLAVCSQAPSAASAGVSEGRDLLDSKGCMACHTLDGRPSLGPTLQQVVERRLAVLTKRLTGVPHEFARVEQLQMQEQL